MESLRNYNAPYKILVGPFLSQENHLVPSIIMISNSRFYEVLCFSSLTITEQEFQQAVTGDPRKITQHQQLFTEIAAMLHKDGRLDISSDRLSQSMQDHFNAVLSQISHDNCMILAVPGLLLLPGLFDIHTHFRTPGQEWKEDFTSGSRAALRGGVTSVFDMPNNRQAIITQEWLDEKKVLARQAMQVNYGFYFGITDENVTTAHQIRGNCGYKIFLGSSTGNLLITHWQTTLPQCYALPKPVIIHAEDEAQIQTNIRHAGTVSALDHPHIRNPKVAEAAVLNIEQSLQDLSKPPCNPIIIAHISTYKELEIIQRLQQQQLPVLSEVTLHHLFLNLEDFEKQPNLLKANPPLRSKEETLALQQALQQNAITFVSSDHAPHTLKEKYSDTPPSGVPGMEYNLLLLFDAFARDKLSLPTIIRACARNPCRYFGLLDTGKIENGLYADCTLLNPLVKTTIDNADVQTKAGFTPFHGWTVHGRIEGTLVNGDIGFWQGEFLPTRPRDLFPSLPCDQPCG